MLNYQKKALQKKYYKIGEVVEITRLPEATLRFYEKEIPQLKPKRTAGGTRQYTQADITLINTIKHLTEYQHLTLEGVRNHLSARGSEEERRQEIVTRLKQVRTELVSIRHHLNGNAALDEEEIIVDQE